MDVLYEDGVLERGEHLGDKVLNRFQGLQNDCELVGEVRGKGPMLALELVKDRETKEPATDEAKTIAAHCLEKGLIILTTGVAGNVIRTLMLLVITDEELERGLGILEEAFNRS